MSDLEMRAEDLLLDKGKELGLSELIDILSNIHETGEDNYREMFELDRKLFDILMKSSEAQELLIERAMIVYKDELEG